MEEISTRLAGMMSSALDTRYAIPDGPSGMLLGHWLTVQSVRQNASETESYIRRATKYDADVTPRFHLNPRGYSPAHSTGGGALAACKALGAGSGGPGDKGPFGPVACRSGHRVR